MKTGSVRTREVSRLPAQLSIGALRSLMSRGELSAEQLLDEVYDRIDSFAPSNPIWLHLVPREQARSKLHGIRENCGNLDQLPFFGLPIAVKDNIDVAGLPTTAGWPAYRYIAQSSAAAVERLEQLGAVVIGKTNMDQLATGLTGARSPLGVVTSVGNQAYVAGGSSSGSAVAVAAGLVPFALGTDSGGSGRIPAAFNGVIGLKPTRGLISLRGTVPNSRTLDCVSVFATSVDDAAEVFGALKAFDAEDPFSRQSTGQASPRAAKADRLVIGIPQSADLGFLGSTAAENSFRRACSICENIGTTRPVEFAPFREAGSFILSGPWVAERIAGMRAAVEQHWDTLLPVIRTVFERAKPWTAVDAFEYLYRLKELRRRVERVFEQIDVLVVPSAPRPMTTAEVAADPIGRNIELGTYSYFVNPLDLCAVAVPVGTADEGVPFGVTIVAPAFADDLILDIASRFQSALRTR
jgi:allophanate hydrolase